jgi:hypothetical protein
VFVVGLGDREVTLLLREGFVTDQFVDLAGREDRSDEEERWMTALKRDLADRVLAHRAEEVFDVEERQGAWGGSTQPPVSPL